MPAYNLQRNTWDELHEFGNQDYKINLHLCDGNDLHMFKTYQLIGQAGGSVTAWAWMAASEKSLLILILM